MDEEILIRFSYLFDKLGTFDLSAVHFNNLKKTSFLNVFKKSLALHLICVASAEWRAELPAGLLPHPVP